MKKYLSKTIKSITITLITFVVFFSMSTNVKAETFNLSSSNMSQQLDGLQTDEELFSETKNFYLTMIKRLPHQNDIVEITNLVETAINEINNLTITEQEKMDEIYNTTYQQVVNLRIKNALSLKANALKEELINGNNYSSSGIENINNIVSTFITSLDQYESLQREENIYNSLLNQISEVPVLSIKSEDNNQISNEQGLDSNYQFIVKSNILSVEELDELINSNSKLKKILNSKTKYHLTYDITLCLDDVIEENFDGNYIIRIKVNDVNLSKYSHYKLLYINSLNEVEEYKAKIDGEYLIFTTNHLSEYILISDKPLNYLNYITEPLLFLLIFEIFTIIVLIYFIAKLKDKLILKSSVIPIFLTETYVALKTKLLLSSLIVLTSILLIIIIILLIKLRRLIKLNKEVIQ